MMPRDWTGHAIGGACIGAMFGYVLLPSIDALEGAWPAAALGAALGSAAAVVFARLHAEQAAARRSTLEAAARALGAHFSAHGDAETQDFYRAFPHLQLSMENVREGIGISDDGDRTIGLHAVQQKPWIHLLRCSRGE